MTELLENSDNTNADTGVSESPSNEATISLAAVQALADALQKIESYTPTVWVDNESPDIDAAHLNKAEQAIMRVTTAMNSAVDVIKDLQSQVNTTNNNLSKKLNGRNVKWFPEGESLATIITESVEVSTYGITPKSCPSEIISGGFGYGTLITAGGRGNQGYGYGFAIYAGTNTAGTRVFATYDKDGGWSERVSKSDLNTVLMYRGVIAGDLNRGRNLAIAPGIYSIQSASTITNGPSDFVGWGIFVQFPDNLFSQMILNSPNYIKFRKYSGSNPSWSAW